MSLVINGVKFDIDSNANYGNYVNSPIVPVETKKIDSNKPDVNYMQTLVTKGEDWSKIANIIDIDFNGAQLKNPDGSTTTINNFAQLMNVLIDYGAKIEDSLNVNVDVEYEDRNLNIEYNSGNRVSGLINDNVVIITNSNTVDVASRMTRSGALYLISGDFNLGNKELKIPSDSTVFFISGKIRNGTIVFDNTMFYGKYCLDNIDLKGTTSHIDINWYKDDYTALRKCLALADENSHMLDITRDLFIKFESTIVTSSSIDFHGHTLTVDFNRKYNPQVFEFNNTTTVWCDYQSTTFQKLINKVNAGDIRDYPEDLRGRIIEIYSSKEVEVYRYGYSNIYLHEMLYVDEYGDLYGYVWNKNIPISANINVRIHKKLTNEIGIKNCIYKMVYDNTTSSSSVYRKNGLKFRNCFNAKIENLTICSDNGNDYPNRENGILDFETVQFLTVRDVYLKSSSNKNLSTESSYGILMYCVNNALFDNVKGASMNNPLVWGIMGSNLLFNMRYINCDFSRIDTHWRCVNMDVDHCNIGYYGIHYTGSGIYNITNSNFQYYGFYTREEYATYFDGVINVTNCRFNVYSPGRPDGQGTTGIFKISPIVDTHEKYKMRGRDVFYCGARQINMDNIYIDCPHEDLLETSLIRLTSTNRENTGSMKVITPNVSVRNVTFNGNKKKHSLNLLYHTMKNVEYMNEPVYNVENCNNVFNNQWTTDYSKYLQKGLCYWNVDNPMPKIKLNVSNTNLWIGQEPTDWDCHYRDCVIEGVYTTDDSRLKANRSFNNCIFRYVSNLDAPPYSDMKGALMRFSNCIFDLPTNEKHHYNAKNIYNVYDVDGGWTIGARIDNKIMTGCMPTKELCAAIGKNQSDFVNVNTITKN